MARKKKPSRKYTPRSEFRYNNSKRAAGHPHYIFGEKDDKYYSLGITSHPKKEYPYFLLSKDPEPGVEEPAAVQRRVFVEKKKVYRRKTLGSWRFNAEDMPVIRHIIKAFKRGQNKK